MAYLDDTGLAYFWGKIKAYIAALLAPKANDADVVHKTGAEVIDGIKTFQDVPVYQKNTSATRSITPSDNNVYVHYEILDTNNDRLGLFEYATRTNGSYDVKINCTKKDGSATADILVGYDVNGTPFAACPSFSFSRTNDCDIVTRSWLYAQSNTGDIYPSRNLNDMVYPGIYYLVENGRWVNLPSGWVNGTLRVYADASQAHIKQVIYRNGSLNSNDHQTCIRTRFNSTWSNWVRNVTFSDVIPIANGGTGASDRLNAVNNLFSSNVGTNSTYFLTITNSFASAGYCSVNDAKTVLGLSNYVPLAGDYIATCSWHRLMSIKSNNYTWNSNNPSSAAYFSILMKDKNDEQFGQVYVQHSAAGNAFAGLSVHAVNKNNDNDGNGYAVNLYLGSAATNRSFRPNQSDILDLGQSGYRWKTVFAQSSTISTSDERLKTNISSYSDDILDAWGEVNFVLYKLKSSVAEKGEDKARIHSGVVAQQAGSVFRAHGIDPAAYGFFCFDSWDAQTEERDDDGRVVEPAREAGDQYSIRYEELLCIEAAYMRRENARLKKHVADLEERLAALELKIS